MIKLPLPYRFLQFSNNLLHMEEIVVPCKMINNMHITVVDSKEPHGKKYEETKETNRERIWKT